jgi:hypothetical protein
VGWGGELGEGRRGADQAQAPHCARPLKNLPAATHARKVVMTSNLSVHPRCPYASAAAATSAAGVMVIGWEGVMVRRVIEGGGERTHELVVEVVAAIEHLRVTRERLRTGQGGSGRVRAGQGGCSGRLLRAAQGDPKP